MEEQLLGIDYREKEKLFSSKKTHFMRNLAISIFFLALTVSASAQTATTQQYSKEEQDLITLSKDK
jgi:hypothetical protein